MVSYLFSNSLNELGQREVVHLLELGPRGKVASLSVVLVVGQVLLGTDEQNFPTPPKSTSIR